jgi:hypothetical protein
MYVCMCVCVCVYVCMYACMYAHGGRHHRNTLRAEIHDVARHTYGEKQRTFFVSVGRKCVQHVVMFDLCTRTAHKICM